MDERWFAAQTDRHRRDVLRVADGRIAEIATFGPALFTTFGLPATPAA